MKVTVVGDKLTFEGFPFKTKEIGLSFIHSGVAIFNEPIKDLKNWQMNVKVENGVCINEKAADKMLSYFKGETSKTFIQTPSDSYICTL